MMQPVGDMLDGNAQCGSVFHQANIVNIGHLRATHTQVGPADHVTKYTLAIIVELGLDLLSA